MDLNEPLLNPSSLLPGYPPVPPTYSGMPIPKYDLALGTHENQAMVYAQLRRAQEERAVRMPVMHPMQTGPRQAELQMMHTGFRLPYQPQQPLQPQLQSIETDFRSRTSDVRQLQPWQQMQTRQTFPSQPLPTQQQRPPFDLRALQGVPHEYIRQQAHEALNILVREEQQRQALHLLYPQPSQPVPSQHPSACPFPSQLLSARHFAPRSIFFPGRVPLAFNPKLQAAREEFVQSIRDKDDYYENLNPFVRIYDIKTGFPFDFENPATRGFVDRAGFASQGNRVFEGVELKRNHSGSFKGGMAPTISSSRANRSGRAQVDHDVMEGLPIRQWRNKETTFGAPPEEKSPASKNAWPELPMPRDSHLLPEMSQQLLRAARAGRLYKPPTPPIDDEKENLDEDEEIKETQKGFVARKWAQVSKHQEEPEPEFLAKRRKGLPSLHASAVISTAIAASGPMRKTKVRKADADGNVAIYEVLVPEGQTVEGEVVEEDATIPAPAPAAPGTVVEGVGVVNADGVVVASDLLQPTPPRRRPPPPRRKPKKGPGRGRKKVMFQDGTTAPPALDEDIKSEDPLGSQTVKQENATEGVTPATEADTPMPDAQEGEEDEEEVEEGEEGDDGDDDEDREEGELSPTPDSRTQSKTPQPPSPERKAAEVVKEESMDVTPGPPTIAGTEQAPVSADPEPTSAVSSTTAPRPLPEPTAAETTVLIPPPSTPASPTKLTSPPDPISRSASSSPDVPLVSHSRQNSLNKIPTLGDVQGEKGKEEGKGGEKEEFADGEDLFGSLERHLERESKGVA